MGIENLVRKLFHDTQRLKIETVCKQTLSFVGASISFLELSDLLIRIKLLQ